MVAEKLLSNNFVKKYCDGDLAIFRGYNPATGVLSLTCSARSAYKFCQLADGTVNSIFEMLDTMDNLRWLDEQCGALVSFGPGFQVSRIIANPSEEVKDTIVVTFGEAFGEFESAVLQLTELSENFCENRSCKPLLFTKSRRFFVTLLTPSIVKELKPILESAFTNSLCESTVTVETKSGNIFEYFAGYNAKNSVGFLDDSSYPTECCAICFAPIVGKYIRLSLCGHVYCDDCFIGLLKNATQFPVSCQSGCLYQILFEDIALVLSRNFSDVDEIQQFLTPVFHISLESFLYAHRSEFIRCQTADCHSLMPLTKEGATSAVGTSMICLGCEMKRCTLCGEAVHQHITCQERQEQKFGIEYPDLTAWKNELPTHRRLCPNVHCKMLIEKGPGCNHMYCNQCGVHFCWLCISFQAGTTDEVYRHLREIHGSIGEPGFVDDEFGLLVQQMGYERAAVMMNVEVAPDGLMMTDPYYAHALMVIEAYTQKEEPEENEEGGDNEDLLLKYGDNLEAMYRQYKKDCEESRQALM
uniref:RBR-type E3 ubiquitin transferase n=1 Tax=Globodera pallida TaxID=36090 RepID=A0A183BIF5_GLOPA